MKGWDGCHVIKLAPCFSELNQRQLLRARLRVLLPQSCHYPCLLDLYLSTPTLPWHTASIHSLPHVHTVSNMITLSLKVHSFPVELQYVYRNPQQPTHSLSSASSVQYCNHVNMYNTTEHLNYIRSFSLSFGDAHIVAARLKGFNGLKSAEVRDRVLHCDVRNSQKSYLYTHRIN